ncbi:type II toxin-antitoxin system Phd/YefM family antitoxin [Isoptericola nanjingensis]|uniref:type II toxin-antitoxin system Phd/YefM family antitoxin n=1 Tax=Isoptericola nanjingensis TaxID=903413 RepID=UPI003D1E3CB9
MKTVNVHEAKTHLSRLLAEVEAGEEVVIARAGHPIARLVGTDPAARPRRELGPLRGRFTMPNDLDHWAQDEVAALFEGDDTAGGAR